MCSAQVAPETVLKPKQLTSTTPCALDTQIYANRWPSFVYVDLPRTERRLGLGRCSAWYVYLIDHTLAGHEARTDTV
jgi:hypothetical protein